MPVLLLFGWFVRLAKSRIVQSNKLGSTVRGQQITCKHQSPKDGQFMSVRHANIFLDCFDDLAAGNGRPGVFSVRPLDFASEFPEKSAYLQTCIEQSVLLVRIG